MFKKITLLGVLAMLCLNISANSQENKPTNFNVWDMLPEQFWNTTHTAIKGGEQTTLQLSSYKGKFIILDFWALWCGACIGKFPLIDSLNHEFQDRLAIIGVNVKATRDTPSKINNLLEGKNRQQRAFKLHTIINDEQLLASFPHKGIPFYVWINEKGKVVAITGSNMLNRSNVNSYLSPKQP